MITRNITPRLTDALADTPVVLLNGPRQAGKTTLAQSLIAAGYPATYLTLDDSSVLAAAADAPGFVAGLTGPVILDEIQHAPQLFPAIKASVDRDRRPGRFLLTGSANVLLLPKISESLAGRMEVLTLWPLAQAEIEGHPGSLTDLLFARSLSLPTPPKLTRDGFIARIMDGGYPEPLSRPAEVRRRAWFESYLTTILQRDVRDIANIEGLSSLPRLLSLLASRVGALLNLTDVSNASRIAYATLHRYMTVLEATFLVQLLTPWSNNLGARLVKTPKLLLNDTGLAASLLGLDAQRLATDGPLLGQFLENFVALEIKKDIGWSATRPSLFHYRTHTRQEVDLVLESPAGDVVGIEVKASSSVHGSDFKGLRSLSEASAGRFVRGLILYGGSQVVPFAENLHAVPLSILWGER